MNLFEDAAYRRRRRLDAIVHGVSLAATVGGVAALVSIIVKVAIDGLPRLSLRFIFSGLSHRPEQTGIWPALFGSLLVVLLTMLIATPLGLATAIYLEEFSSAEGRLGRLLKVTVANLAGVPSVVYGLVGLAVFVRWMALGQSVIAGALTLALVVLPMIVIVSREALRGVPTSYREASLGLGSNRLQAVGKQVLPYAMRGIWTGLLLAFSRAIGETAPLMVVGAAYYVTGVPSGITDSYTVLPMQIFNWASDARRDFHADAAAATLVLVFLLIALNGVVLARRRSTYVAID